MKNTTIVILVLLGLYYLSRKKPNTDINGVKILPEAPGIDLGKVPVNEIYWANTDTRLG